MPYLPLISNHDHRNICAEIILETPQYKRGFVKLILATEKVHFILLDTFKHKNNEMT